jgi:CMP-N,N'-diacetyllegionaminic acid synthase
LTWDGLSVLAIVPARAGSKGIARKNLCRVGPRSLIGWAAHTASQLSWIDRAVISTDDRGMADEGRRHGLEAPFLRPAELASDTASSADMWRHAWLESENTFERRFDLSILLQPTTPLRKAADVERTVKGMVEGGRRAAATVSRTPGHFAPQKCLTLDEKGVLAFYHGGGAEYAARQAIPAYYYRNGVCYAVMRDTLIEHGHIVEDDCLAVIVDEYVVNIDDPIELELAEFMLSRDSALGNDSS